MGVTLNEMKNYLRIDSDEDDELIKTLIASAEQSCLNILRTDDLDVLYSSKNGKPSVMYAVNYMYEHRTDADFKSLALSLRSLLYGERTEVF